MKEAHRRMHILLEAGSLIVIIVAILLFMFFMVVYLAPMSYWLEYQSVEPVSAVVKVDAPIKFRSKLHVYRKIDVTWNDVLYCRDMGKSVYDYYCDYTSKKMNAEKSEGLKETVWVYGNSVDIPTECYLRSAITIALPWGLEKTQVVKSKTFRVVK